jgi:tetratricopeptide (TPR) repeat protein
MLREYFVDLKSIDVQEWLDRFATNKDAIKVILGILGILLIRPIIRVIQWILKRIRSTAPMPKEEAPEATKTDNSQTQNFASQSEGNVARRDVNIIQNHTNGEDQERYRKSVEHQVNDLTNRLERANQYKGALNADKQRLQNEINDLRAKLFDIEASFEATSVRADSLAAQLTTISNQVDPEQLVQARGLLAEFEFDGAEKILTQIVNDQELNVRQSAAAHYGLGEIAEESVKWEDALEHYKRAYGQDATLEHQKAYARLCWWMGQWDEAVPLHKDILEQVAAEHGKAGNEYAAALNNLAAIYQSTGRYSEAMPLFAEALSIRRCVLGADHPDTAESLNNLAVLYRVQERHTEAAPLLKEAVEIIERSIQIPRLCVKIMRGCWRSWRRRGRSDPFDVLIGVS